MTKKAARRRKLIIWFNELQKEDTQIVGGKCANLGELIRANIPVPVGFAITAFAYEKFITESGIAPKIYATIREIITEEGKPELYEKASKKIRRIIEDTPIPRKIEKAIKKAYRDLSSKVGRTVYVAVRSSATAEDLPGASFAGQQETFLNVKGGDELLDATRKCWSSLFTPRAIFYRTEKGFPHESVLISVAVQKMVNAKCAGVMFTLHPVSGDISKIVIEGNWGLGETVVSGSVTPDEYIVDKNTLTIEGKKVATKSTQRIRDLKTGKTIEIDAPKELQNEPCLNDEEVKRLAELGKAIEEHYGIPQDVEWSIEMDAEFPKSVQIVQSRPETVWTPKRLRKRGVPTTKLAPTPAPTTPTPTTYKPPAEEDRVVVAKGLPASPGLAYGKARVGFSPGEMAKIFEKGDLLVTKMTTPDWATYMRVASGIITDEGGMTCHAAIVSRELGIPCVVGTRNATKVMETGRDYTLDAKTGVVYEGILEEFREEIMKPEISEAVATPMPITATKIYVNLSLPEVAEKVFRKSRPDGVGLLRAEHLMLSVGKHPRLLIEEGGAQRMIDTFAEGVRRVAEVFAPGPVVYRFLDFKPDEFLSLPGGEKYEREAGHVGPNPLIGYRGCFRYIKEPDVFRLECRAIKKIREEYGLKNVWVMLPFVRTLQEFRVAKKIMEEEGLVRGLDFKLWIMVEVPSSGILIDKFIEEGLDGVSFGTNDYTMLILGLDRNDAAVQELYDERDLAVLRLVSHVIRICKEHGVTTSICGQAPSNYPEYLEFLIREGATSISVNPDVVNRTRLMAASIEQKLLLEELRRAGKRSAEPLYQPRWSEELR